MILRVCLYTSIYIYAVFNKLFKKVAAQQQTSGAARARETCEREPKSGRAESWCCARKYSASCIPRKKLDFCSKTRGASTGGLPPSSCNHQPPFYSLVLTLLFCILPCAPRGSRAKATAQSNGCIGTCGSKPEPCCHPPSDPSCPST